MLGGFQQRPRLLWQVSATGYLLNERSTGISGENPREINEAYTLAYFTIRMVSKNNLPLAGVRIYGAIDAGGFPAPGTPTEALISTTQDLAVGCGIIRAPAMHASDADAPSRPIILPTLLLLEFDTDVAGGSPQMTFIVEGSFIGPMIMGTH